MVTKINWACFSYFRRPLCWSSAPNSFLQLFPSTKWKQMYYQQNKRLSLAQHFSVEKHADLFASKQNVIRIILTRVHDHGSDWSFSSIETLRGNWVLQVKEIKIREVSWIPTNNENAAVDFNEGPQFCIERGPLSKDSEGAFVCQRRPVHSASIHSIVVTWDVKSECKQTLKLTSLNVQHIPASSTPHLRI